MKHAGIPAQAKLWLSLFIRGWRPAILFRPKHPNAHAFQLRSTQACWRVRAVGGAAIMRCAACLTPTDVARLR